MGSVGMENLLEKEDRDWRAVLARKAVPRSRQSEYHGRTASGDDVERHGSLGPHEGQKGLSS